MILADKIIKQRKKNGWSQEELADKMNVSRQAVSKWESAQTIPDIDKIMKLGELFGVTIDYLLKDSIEDEEFAETAEEKTLKKISLEDANKYLAHQKKNGMMVALGVLLAVISPVILLILGGLNTINIGTNLEDVFSAIGIVSMLALIAGAVSIFVICGQKNKPYEFLNKIEPFELEYGVKGMVEEKQKKSNQDLKKYFITAICLSIFAPIPIIIGVLVYNIGEGKLDLTPFMVALALVIAGIASGIWTVLYTQKSSMQKLLREEDFSDMGKKKSQLKGIVSFAWWMVIVVAYLIWSLAGDAWDISWLLPASGAMLYPVAMAICDFVTEKKEKENQQ